MIASGSVRGPIVAALAWVVVPLAGCSSGASPGAAERTIEVDGQMVSEASLRDAVTGSCTVRGLVSTYPLEARDVFSSRAHDRRHTIAAAVQGIGRTVAASRLQAKAVVEEDLDRYPSPPSIVGDLDLLTSAIRTALETLSIRTEDR
ncbi:hypothetical protein HRbin12_01271 [bacterium HR12]|nr:hypothetical protein HRbin12_01271 [bacterium HR12]GIU98387.1 MAG: hypothetical protein KatS3mg014_0003 [Actinomycetota bacterium]